MGVNAEPPLPRVCLLGWDALALFDVCPLRAEIQSANDTVVHVVRQNDRGWSAPYFITDPMRMRRWYRGFSAMFFEQKEESGQVKGTFQA